MTDIAAPSSAAPGTADTGKRFVQKPEKPDQIEYEKNLQVAQEEHDRVRQQLVCARSDSQNYLNFGVSQGSEFASSFRDVAGFSNHLLRL